MVSTRKLGGIGAIGSASARFFHPGERIREQYPVDTRVRLVNVVITGEGRRLVARRQQMCYLVSVPNVDGECHIVKHNFRVDVSPAAPFESEVAEPAPAPRQQAVVDTDRTDGQNVVPNVFGGDDNIEQLRAEGIEVDDDTEPLPDEATALPEPEAAAYSYDKPTFCPRRVDHMPNNEGSWVNHRWDEIAAKSEFELFRMTMPEQFIQDVVLPATNVFLTDEMTMGEFYKWLGCHFFMACFQGIKDRNDWWSTAPIDMFSGAPFRLNEFMTKRRFLEITAAIVFTDVPPPTLAEGGFVDRFHDIRKLIDAWNDHMAAEYNPSWLNCLDESMNSWLSKFCPGFMCVPRKPHPFGNEYHAIADGDGLGKPILWRMKLVEGKDRPKKADGRTWAYPTEYDSMGATAKTMMTMTKPIHGQGKIVIGDSGFCVRDGVLACHRAGVFFQAYVKKRKAWPRGVPGDEIDEFFANRQLGECDTLTQYVDGIRFLVHCCRDSKYVSKIMSTHGMLDECQEHRTWRKVDGHWRSFNYTEPFSRYSRVKHWVDDHNNRRHDPIGLEEAWATKWWPMRQFTFICAVAEVNACYSQARGRREATVPQLDFRRKLAQQLLQNTLDVPVIVPVARVANRNRSNTVHALRKRGKNEGKWQPGQRCFKEVRTVYLVLKCQRCQAKMCRTYCACHPSTPLCEGCFALHYNEVE